MPASYDLGTARGRIIIDTTDLTRASAAFTTFGKGMLGVGALAVAGFGVAVKKAADFEKTIDAAGAVLGKTGAQMAGVSKIALQIGQDTKFSAQEVAEGINELAKAGLTINQITGGAARGVTDLAAAAGDMGLQEAADIAVAAMKTFNIPAKDLSRVADSMAGAANKSLLNVDDLGVSMRYAGGTAKAMGLTIEELNTVLAILGDRGIRGSTAGTSLRGVLLSLSGTSGPAKAKLKELGIITEDGGNKFFDASGKLKGMADVMQVLQDATKDLSPQLKTAAFNTIFQRRAMASALFMAEAGGKGFRQYAKDIGAVSAADVAAKKLDNLAGDIEKLTSNIDTLLIKAGTPFQEQLREWTQMLTRLVQVFADLSPGTQRLIMNLLLYGGLMFAAMGITSLMIGTVLKFAASMKQMGAAMAWVAKRTGLMGALTRLRGALALIRLHILGGVIPALKSMGLFMVAHPALLLAAGLVLLGVALYNLYKRWKPFRELVDRTWQDFQRGWDEVQRKWREGVARFKDGLRKIGDALVEARGAVGRFVRGVSDWFEKIPGIVVEALTDLPGQVVGVFDRMWDAVYESTKHALGRLVHHVSQLPEYIATALGFALGRTIRWGVQMAVAFVRFRRRVVKEITEFFLEVRDDFIVGLKVIDREVREFADGVAEWFRLLPGRVTGYVNRLWDETWANFQRGKTVVIGEMMSFSGGVVEWFRLLPGRVVTYVDQLWNETWANFHRGKTIVLGVVQEWFGGVVGWFQLLPGRISGWVSGAWNQVWADFHRGKTRVFGVLLEFGRDILGFLKELPGRMLRDLGNVTTSIYNKFMSIGSSAWNGFRKGLFGSPKTKIQYALEDLMGYVQGYNMDMGREMAKLQSMTFDKMGNTAITSIAEVSQGAGASPKANMEETPLATPSSSTSPAIGTVNIIRPPNEPAEDSLFATGQQLAYLGAFG